MPELGDFEIPNKNNDEKMVEFFRRNQRQYLKVVKEDYTNKIGEVDTKIEEVKTDIGTTSIDFTAIYQLAKIT